MLPTLRSVQAQTWTDFECLVVDDGSRDGAALACVVEGLNDPRFRLIRRDNGGGGAARNTGILAATGDWIAFLDSDDLFLPEKLEKSMAALSRCPKTDRPENLVICSFIKVLREEGLSFSKPHRAPRHSENIAEYLLADRGFIQTSTLVVPAWLARQVQFDPTLPCAQDSDFCIRLWLAGATFEMLEEGLVLWDDRACAARVSSTRTPQAIETWLERLRPRISARAYWGYKGWHFAKLKRSEGMARPLVYWLTATARGVFGPKLAITVFLQILLTQRQYRSLSNVMLQRFKLGV